MRWTVRGTLALSVLTLVFYQGTEVVRAQVAPSDADEVLVMVNQARAEAGVPPLRANAALQQAAQSWAQYMAVNNYLNHFGRDGSTPADRMAAAGYQGETTGENLAKGFSNALSVMNSWLNSPSHRANILNPQFAETGVGVYTTAYGTFWVQTFGGGSADQPATQIPLPPSVSTIAPAFSHMGEDVLISGQRFGGEPGTVMFSGGLTGEIQDWNDRAIRVTVPYGASTGMVYVQNPAGTSSGTYLYVQLPLGDETIIVPTPAPAPVTPPTPTPPLPSTPPPPPSSRTPTASPVSTPQTPLPSSPATGRLTVSRAPNLMSLTPGSGRVGDAVLLVGNWNSSQPLSVTFNGVNAPILAWDATSVSVRVPTGATSGPVQLRTDAGSSNVLTFTVTTTPVIVWTPLPVSTPPPPVTVPAPQPPVTTPAPSPAPRSTPTLSLPSRIRPAFSAGSR
jgi:Cysteine-rich secretory protein family